jgi:hypothetical protein
MQFPAYIALIDSLNNLCVYPDTTKKLLTFCLHSNQPIIFSPYPPLAWDLVNLFYNKTYDLLFSNENYINADAIGNLIYIIETAKTKKYITTQDNFGYTLLNLVPTRYIIDFGTNCCNLNYDQSTTKNRISIFYQLIVNYNRQRNDKKTPHEQQYNCYKLIQDTNLALPNNFSSDLFDPNIYAFEELSELINSTKALSKVNDNCVEEYVNACYPDKLTLKT